MRIINVKEVLHKTGLGRTSIHKLETEGKFPSSVSLGCRRKGYNEEEVDSWIMERIEERNIKLKGN